MITQIGVFGGTGRTGEYLIAEALARGWHVRALCRPGRRPAVTDAALGVINGPLTDPVAVEETLCDGQAACCVVGPRPPYTDLFCAAATQAIIAAAQRAGVRRLICQTGAMIGPYRANRTWPFDLMARMFARQRPAAALDRWQQEVAVRESDLDWTLIKPPRLTDAPARGRARTGPHVRVGMLSKVSRMDLARIIADEVAAPRFRCETVFVST